MTRVLTGLFENNQRDDRSGRRAGFGSKDGVGYFLPDSGCKKATNYLKHQSLCLKCPFDICNMDKDKMRVNS